MKNQNRITNESETNDGLTSEEEAVKDQRLKPRRPGSRIHPSYIDDQALVCTSYLSPDITGCPRFRFHRLKEPESSSQVIVYKNSLIDSYYPTIECDRSEDRDSQKSHSEVGNVKESANGRSLYNKDVTHLQSSMKKPSIDSRTFTIYSCKSYSTLVHKTDNPQPEGILDLEGNCERLSKLQCFSQLHKRIEKLEEKLQQTLIKSIQFTDETQKKSTSIQKLFHMVSGVLERNGKSREQQSFDSDNSDSENELRIIKKRLEDLEKKLKTEKNHSSRGYLQSTTTNDLISKNYVNDKYSERSKIILKESDYTEPFHSDTDSCFQREHPLKNREKIAADKAKQVKQKLLSKCKILNRKSNFNKKLSIASGECQNIETERLDEEMLSCKAKHLIILPVNLTDSRQNNLNFEPEWKRKFRKKKRKKNRTLCKKNSKINIFTGENRNLKVTPANRECKTYQNQKSWVPCSCAECPYKNLSVSLPFPSDSLATSFGQPNSKTVGLPQKPLDFLKYGSNVKMPVLFEEILGKPKTLGDNNEASKMSMRFVLTQRRKDPLAMLKNLVKKLSHTRTSQTKLQ